MRLSTYHRLAAELYDFEDPQRRRRILDFCLRHAESAPFPFLEPMCGTGYFLIPFLERGADIDGLDASEDMLNVCRAQCIQRGVQPTLYRRVLPDLDLPRRYGYIFIPDRSFGLLYEEEAARATLTRLRDALLPGGRLVLDVAPPPERWENTGTWEGSWCHLPDGSTVLSSLLVAHEERGRILRVFAKHECFADGRLIEAELDEYAERLYMRAEMYALLATADFSTVRVYKAYEDSDPGELDRMVFICER